MTSALLIVRKNKKKTSMFSTKARLIQRTGKNGVGRYDFLKLLANEYKTSKSKGKKKSVIILYVCKV